MDRRWKLKNTRTGEEFWVPSSEWTVTETESSPARGELEIEQDFPPGPPFPMGTFDIDWMKGLVVQTSEAIPEGTCYVNPKHLPRTFAYKETS